MSLTTHYFKLLHGRLLYGYTIVYLTSLLMMAVLVQVSPKIDPDTWAWVQADEEGQVRQ